MIYIVFYHFLKISYICLIMKKINLHIRQGVTKLASSFCEGVDSPIYQYRTLYVDLNKFEIWFDYKN